jgi:hypothetical protein
MRFNDTQEKNLLGNDNIIWSHVLIYFYISFLFFFLFYHLRAANEGVTRAVEFNSSSFTFQSNFLYT